MKIDAPIINNDLSYDHTDSKFIQALRLLIEVGVPFEFVENLKKVESENKTQTNINYSLTFPVSHDVVYGFYWHPKK